MITTYICGFWTNLFQLIAVPLWKTACASSGAQSGCSCTQLVTLLLSLIIEKMAIVFVKQVGLPSVCALECVLAENGWKTESNTSLYSPSISLVPEEGPVCMKCPLSLSIFLRSRPPGDLSYTRWTCRFLGHFSKFYLSNYRGLYSTAKWPIEPNEHLVILNISGHVLVEIVEKLRGQCSRTAHGPGPTLYVTLSTSIPVLSLGPTIKGVWKGNKGNKEKNSYQKQNWSPLDFLLFFLLHY